MSTFVKSFFVTLLTLPLLTNALALTCPPLAEMKMRGHIPGGWRISMQRPGEASKAMLLSNLDRFTEAHTDNHGPFKREGDRSFVGCRYVGIEGEYGDYSMSLMSTGGKGFPEEAFKGRPNWDANRYAPGYGVWYSCENTNVTACAFG